MSHVESSRTPDFPTDPKRLEEVIVARQKKLAESLNDLKVSIAPQRVKHDVAQITSRQAAGAKHEIEAKTLGQFQGADGQIETEKVAIAAAIALGLVTLIILRSIRKPK